MKFIKSNVFKVILVLFLFLTVLIGLSVYYINRYYHSNSTYNYKLTYYKSDTGYYYILKTNKNMINVEKHTNIVCIKDPCPTLSDSYSVLYKEKYAKLFDELFDEESNNERSVNEEDLDLSQRTIINEIVKEKTDNTKITYNILNSGYDSDYKKRGYHIDKDNNRVVLTVASGEKNTGGYYIDVAKVVINNDTAQIFVKEVSPDKDSNVTMAFTYPVVQIEFNKMPAKMIVQNIDTKETFEQINDN